MIDRRKIFVNICISVYLAMSSKTASHRRHHRKTNKKHCGTSECALVTHHGIAGWYKHLFEELGWMILAKKRGMMDKVGTYLHSLQRFKNSIEYKISTTQERDRKQDLQIMHSNICVLLDHVERDLTKN
jgi:predicted ATP-binding protein involved in virulence